MKPHLPLKLRAALLAALVAVSFSTYSPAASADEEDSSSAETRVYEGEWTAPITSSQILESYDSITISNNKGSGAAINVPSSGSISITNSNNVLIVSNAGRNTNSANGGAVYVASSAQLEISLNESVTFIKNRYIQEWSWKYPLGCPNYNFCHIR